MWFAFLWACLSTVLLFALVGIPLARIIGLRGFSAVAVAPAFAVTIIGGTAVVAAWFGLAWAVLPVLLVTVVVGAALAGIRYGTRRHRPAGPVRRPFDGWLLVGVVVAATLVAVRFVAIIGQPESISQTFDNIFHLNGVRFILDTGNASSLWLGRMSNPGGSLAFYPAAWHGVVSLVVQVSGASIPVAVSAFTLVVSSIAWPLGILLLTRTLFGRSPVLSVSAGLLAAALPVFPFLLMDYGVLYPYQLGVALLPVALAATLGVLGLMRGGAPTGKLWWGVALVGVLPGLALAHPGALVAWLALTVPMAIAFIVRRWRATSTVGGRLWIAAGTVGYLAVGFLLVRELRPPADARGWPISMTVVDALVAVVSASAWYQVPAVLAGLGVVAGIVWAFVSRSMSALIALGIYAVAAALFVTVAAGPSLFLRDAMTGPWYNNVPRLAALLPIAMVPLGAYGIACTWARVVTNHAVRARITSWPRLARDGIATALAILAAVLTQVGPLTPVPVAQQWAAFSFRDGPDTPLLSSDERALIDRLDEHVPEGVAIAGSPWTGSSLAYALADRPVLMPHTLMEITEELQAVNEGLSEAEAGGEVCAALEAMGVGFVLDFGTYEVHPGQHPFPGFVDLAGSDAVRLVDEQGAARLYEIVACDA